MWALFHTALPQTWCGNYAIAIALVDEVVHLADEKSSPFWKAGGTSQRGAFFALANKPSDAVPTIACGDQRMAVHRSIIFDADVVIPSGESTCRTQPI